MSSKKALKKILDAAAENSDQFMKSGKGTDTRNFVPVKGDIAPNPDRKHGSGFGDSYGPKSELVSKNTKTPKQLSDFISQHAAGNHGAKLDDFSNGLKIGGNKPSSTWTEHPNQKAHHTKMAKEGRANEIGDHVPNKKDYLYMHEIPQSQGGTGPNADNYMTKGFGGGEKNYMTKGDNSLTKFNAKDFYGNGGSIKKTTLGKGGLSDDDINVIGFTGAAGAGLGEGISSAMDDSYSSGKQNAQSYWTNKKNTDRGGK